MSSNTFGPAIAICEYAFHRRVHQASPPTPEMALICMSGRVPRDYLASALSEFSESVNDGFGRRQQDCYETRHHETESECHASYRKAQLSNRDRNFQYDQI